MNRLSLENPENYEGYWKHPAEDNKLRKVKKATITPCQWSETGWVNLEIIFEGNKKRFSKSSPSIKGAIQIFAFQCRKGSRWTTDKY